ncbi:MAG: hypothetical protein LBL13_03550 [Bacteroidales bacterium]|jgi:hypothetical protein|nr:hypothetical protein [Bacteroidales bacterium]
MKRNENCFYDKEYLGRQLFSSCNGGHSDLRREKNVCIFVYAMLEDFIEIHFVLKSYQEKCHE